MMDKIAIVDTTFARFDMRAVAEDELKRQPGFGKKFELVRATVPGIKDLAVACKRLIERESCSIALAFGTAGRTERNRLSAHEASLGLMAAQPPYQHTDSPGICAMRLRTGIPKSYATSPNTARRGMR